MITELNLWFNTTSGGLYGSLRDKRTQTPIRLDNFRPIDKFCAFSHRTKLMDTNTLDLFINDPTRDHDALYAWSKDRTAMVWWNTSSPTAYVFTNGRELTFERITKTYEVKGMPDVIFRYLDR